MYNDYTAMLINIKLKRAWFSAAIGVLIFTAFALMIFDFPDRTGFILMFSCYGAVVISGWRYFNCKCPRCNKGFTFPLLPFLKNCFHCKLPINYT